MVIAKNKRAAFFTLQPMKYINGVYATGDDGVKYNPGL